MSLPAQTSKLALLPDEVIQCILENASPYTAIILGQVSRRFREVVNEPLLWRSYCLSTFEYWSQSHRITERINTREPVDWKDLFIQRSIFDRKIHETLDRTIASPLNRNAHLQTILEAGDDAKAPLLKELHVNPHSEDFLARRYWSHASLCSLSKRSALQTWLRMRYRLPTEPTLEEALGAFDLFIRGGDPQDLSGIIRRIDRMVNAIRGERPDISDLTPRQRAIVIAEFLLRHRFVGITGERSYHALSHNFLGAALSGEDHSSLPLVSVALYSALCNRFGLTASPCNFPLHIHAVIYPPEGIDLDGKPTDEDEGPPMYMDPWRSSEEIPITSLYEQLSMILGTPVSDHNNRYLLPASPVEITLRSARNILNSIRQTDLPGSAARHNDPSSPGRIDLISARYSALFALVILSTPSAYTHGPNNMGTARFIPYQEVIVLLGLFNSHFPQDLCLIEKYIVPIIENIGGNFVVKYIRAIRQMREQDSIPRKSKRRSDYPPGHVKYRVGQVFRHRRYNYQAIITGWDPRCDADEAWIETMQVDSLPGGREQCFYGALVREDLSTRYVASENIEILSSDELRGADPSFPFHDSIKRPVEELQTGDFELEVGRFFKRWDEEKGMFINGMVDEYPED